MHKKISSLPTQWESIQIREIEPRDIQEADIKTLHSVAKKWFGIEMGEDDIRNHILLSDKVYLMIDRENYYRFFIY